MRTKDTNIMDIFSKKPIERRGESTPEKPLKGIHVNQYFEVPSEISDDMCLSPAGDPFAPFPYQPLVNDERVDIYSGDGRLIASLFIENFSSKQEMVKTAYLMSKAPVFCKAASIALLDLGRFHRGIKKEDVDSKRYDEQSKLYYPAIEEVYGSHIPEARELYEPVYGVQEESVAPEEVTYVCWGTEGEFRC